MDIRDVKFHLNEPVRYNENDGYILTAGIIRKNKENEFYYQAELSDVKCGHSTVICELREVEPAARKII